MSAAEPNPVAPRRIRHEVRDGLSAAGLSLGASIAVTALIWVALRWLV
ncbi:MAG TPA: hypothetical protein VIT20_02910 [Propionibacteriaceae bacterium]